MASGSFSLLSKLTPGYFVDVYDFPLQRWRVARIEKVEDNGDLKLAYNDANSTERLSPSSNRLHPFRLHTSCYTDPPSPSPRAWISLSTSSHPYFELLSYDDIWTRIEAYELVQEVRGKMFFLGQELARKDILTKEEQKAIIDVGDKVNSMITLWMMSSEWVIPHLNTHLSRPDSYLCDPQSAFASIWPELFSLFTLLLRCTALLDDALLEISPDNHSQTAQQYFCTHFGLREGQFFEMMEMFVNYYRENEPNARIPLGVMQRLPVWEVCERFGFHDTNLRFHNCLRARLSIHSPLDVSFCSASSYDSFLRFYFSQFFFDPHNRESDSLLLLNLLMQLISDERINVRVEGMGILAMVIGEREKAEKEGRRWFTDSNFVHFAVNNSLPYQLLTDRPSPLLLRKSIPLFLELAKSNQLDTDVQSGLVAGAYSEDSEPDLRDAIFAILVAVSEHVPIKVLFDIYKQLASATVFEDEKSVNRAGAWMKAAGKVMETHPESKQSFFIEGFVNDVISPHSEGNCDALIAKIKCIAECLTLPGYNRLARVVFDKASDCLFATNSLAIPLISELIAQLPPSDTVTFLNVYQENRERQGKAPTGMLKVMLREVVLRITGEKELRQAFELVDRIAGRKEKQEEIDMEDLTVMMENFLGKMEAGNAFCWWLMNTPSLSTELSNFLFETMVASFTLPAISTYPLPIFSCFLHFFISYNVRYQRLLADSGVILERKSTDLPGLTTLAEFVVYSDLSEVRAASTASCLDLYTLLPPSVAKKTIKSFLQSLTSALDSAQNPEIFHRILNLLLQYISRLNEITTPATSPTGSLLYFYLLPNDTEWRRNFLPADAKFCALRREIAQVWRENPAELCLSYNNEKHYSFVHDRLSLADFPHPLHFVVTKITEKKYEFVPISVGLGSNLKLFYVILDKLNTETDENQRNLLWKIAAEVTDNKIVKMQVMEGGKSFRKMLEGSFYEQLVCFLTIFHCENRETLGEFLQKRDKYAFFEVMQRNAMSGGGLFEFLCNFDGYLSNKYAVLLISIVFDMKFACPIDSLQAFVTYLFDLLYILAKNPEKNHEKPISQLILSIFHTNFDVNAEILLKIISEYRHFTDLLFTSISNSKSPNFSKEMLDFWVNLSDFSVQIGAFIIQTAFNRFKEAVNSAACSHNYFILCEKLYLSHQLYDIDEMYAGLLSCIQESVKEVSSRDEHSGFAGLFTLFRVILRLKPGTIPQNDVIMIASCVFDGEESAKTHSSHPLCKSYQSRSGAFGVLAEMASKDVEAAQIISRFSREYHYDVSFRTEKLGAWGRGMAIKEKGETGGVGLKNMRATCYLNSVVQSLFGIPRVRKAVLACGGDRSPDGEMMRQLQRLFVGLEMSDKSYISTRRLCSSYLTLDDLPLPLDIQQDASEFLEGLLNKLSFPSLSDPPSSLFQGKTVILTTGCHPCSHSSSHSDTFFCLRLSLPTIGTSVLNSFEMLISSENISGENAWGCERCGKTPAKRETHISALPQVLLLSLNRFIYSHEFAQRVKVNSYCEFPEVLHLSPYMDDTHAAVPEYALKGVIVHRGMAEAGHYSIYLEHAEKWRLFDDTSVTEVSFDEVKRNSYGTPITELEKMTENERMTQQNAFILIYETASNDSSGEARDSEEISAMRGERDRKNIGYWKKRRAFSREYQEFISELLTLSTPLSPFLALQYIFTIGIRSSPLPAVILKRVYDIITENREIAHWSLSVFTQKAMFCELILTNPIPHARKLMISFAVRSYENSENTAKLAFIRTISNIRKRIPHAIRAYEGMFELIYRLAMSEKSRENAEKLIEIALFPIFSPKNAKFEPDFLEVPNAEVSFGRDSDQIPDRFPISDSETDFSFIPHILNLSISWYARQDLVDSLRNSEILGTLVRGTIRKTGANHLFYAVFTMINSLGDDEGKILLDKYVETLRMAVFVGDNAALRCALIQVKRLLTSMNDIAMTRAILSQIESSLTENLSKYIHAGEETVSFLYKLCRFQPTGLEWLLDNTDIREHLQKWLDKYLTFTQENPQHMQLDKCYDAASYAVPFKPKEKVKQRVREMVSGEMGGDEVDSDDEFEAEGLCSGSLVNIRCEDVTYRSRIIDSYSAVLHLQYTDYPDKFYIAVDDDRLKNVPRKPPQ